MFNKTYVVVCKDRIICKKVADFDATKKTLRCQNLNPSPEYQDFDLALENVVEVFRVVKKQFLAYILFKISAASSKTSSVFAKQKRRNLLS